MTRDWQKTEEFEVRSADGERMRVRKTVKVDTLHDLARTTYTGLLRGGAERTVTPITENRFRIGSKEFKRLLADLFEDSSHAR